MFKLQAILLWLQANNPTPTPTPQSTLSWLQANASWLQVVAGIAQALFAGAAIPFALWAASKNARLAFKLSEERENNQRKEQIRLVHFSLYLEIQRNSDDLKRFYNNLSEFTRVSDEESDKALDADTELSETLNARQRFIALHMPSLSYRFWHSQQLSSLLPAALNQLQIGQVNLIYSQFDRLSQIGNIFRDKAAWGGEGLLPSSGAGNVMGPTLQLSAKELDDLLDQFDTILKDVIEMTNPLAGMIKETTSAP